MGLFKKKKKDEPAQQAAQHKEQEQRQEVQAFAAQFLPEEMDLLAVTAPAGINYHKDSEESDLWHVTLGLTAWLDKYGSEIEMGSATLEAMLDAPLLEYLLGRIPPNFIIAVTARPAPEGDRFLMTGLPTPAFDPDLKAIVDAQKAPVRLEVEGLGTFTLNRNLGWFETAVDWLGREISLTFDQAEEGREEAQDTARALLADAAGWDERIREFAADALLEQARQLVEEEEYLSREDFLAQLEPESILAAPGGAFEFWFGGEDLFFAHPVHVTGTLADGPQQAGMEEQEA